MPWTTKQLILTILPLHLSKILTLKQNKMEILGSCERCERTAKSIWPTELPIHAHKFRNFKTEFSPV